MLQFNLVNSFDSEMTWRGDHMSELIGLGIVVGIVIIAIIVVASVVSSIIGGAVADTIDED